MKVQGNHWQRWPFSSVSFQKNMGGSGGDVDVDVVGWVEGVLVCLVCLDFGRWWFWWDVAFSGILGRTGLLVCGNEVS